MPSMLDAAAAAHAWMFVNRLIKLGRIALLVVAVGLGWWLGVKSSEQRVEAAGRARDAQVSALKREVEQLRGQLRELSNTLARR